MFTLLWQELNRSRGPWGCQAAVLACLFQLLPYSPSASCSQKPNFSSSSTWGSSGQSLFPALCPFSEACAGSDSQQPDCSHLSMERETLIPQTHSGHNSFLPHKSLPCLPKHPKRILILLFSTPHIFLVAKIPKNKKLVIHNVGGHSTNL